MNCSGNITKNFTIDELANKSAKDSVKLVITPRFIKFIQMVQELRDWFNKPIKVNSCYRTVSFNKSCGGSSNSLHLDGLAMDWGISGHTDQQRKNVTEKWKEICAKHKEIGGINYYSHGYHVDIGEEKFGNKTFTVRDYRGKTGDW